MSDPDATLRARLTDDVRIVLVQPQHPANVGSAARAMANMGLRDLWVVDPAPSYDPETVRWLAPGSSIVHERIRVVATLAEALEGIHLVFATSARHRRHQQVVLEPREAAAHLLDGPPGRSVAILFGREDFGLPAEASQSAAALVRIPTDAHASLNLGQAVLLVAHHLFEEARARGLEAEGRVVDGRGGTTTTSALAAPAEGLRLATVDELEPVIGELSELLQRVGYTRNTTAERLLVTLREGLQRAGVSERQARAIRGMVRRTMWALDHPELDPTRTTGQADDEVG